MTRLSFQKALSEFALSSTCPPELRMFAADRMIDTVAVSLLASDTEFGADLVRSKAIGEGPASVLGTARKTSADVAAFLNGCFAHAGDFDDTHRRAATHASSVVVPVVLALAEQRGCTVGEALDALAVGLETAVRLGIEGGPECNRRGFHATSALGLFGGVAAGGRLLGLSPDVLTSAFGIVGSMSGGLHQYRDGGGDTKRLHSGLAARAAVDALDLSVAGIRGPDRVLEGPYGVFQALIGRPPSGAFLESSQLGEHWECRDLQGKRHPCCHFLQAVVDAAIDLRGEVDLSTCSQIVVLIPRDSVRTVAEPRDTHLQVTEYSARFSLYYVAALALLDGALNLSEANVRRSEVARIANLIRYEVIDSTAASGNYEGGVRVRADDGRQAERVLQNPHPLTSSDVTHKASEISSLLGRSDAWISGWYDVEASVQDCLPPEKATRHSGKEQEVSSV